MNSRFELKYSCESSVLGWYDRTLVGTMLVLLVFSEEVKQPHNANLPTHSHTHVTAPWLK